MRALIHSAFGPAESVLAVREIEPPVPATAEVLVRVKAVGVAKGNWLITRGLPFIARPSYGVRKPSVPVAGLEFAGVVAAVGAEVRDFSVGDEVFGQHAGAMAELVAAPQSAIAHKPAAVSFVQAAATPISGLAALQAVRDAGGVRAGHRVLVIGASGGVGSFAVQIAKAFGATVTGVASTRSLERLRALGADAVIDYTREAIDARGAAYDVVLDIAGNRPVGQLRRVLKPQGTLVIVGGTGGDWTMGFERSIGAMLLNPFVSQRLVALLSTPNAADLATLGEFLGDGRLSPQVHPPLPLERAAEAIERVGRGTAAGSLVIAF